MEAMEVECVIPQRILALRERLTSLEEEATLIARELASLEGHGHHTTCRHTCAHHGALIDPAVWSNMPRELLQLIFARLPLPDIFLIPSLSGEWWRISQDQSFRRLCALTESPKMFALVDEAALGRKGDISIRLFDGERHTWHTYEMQIKPGFHGDTMLACDGGLVCFVSRMVDKDLHPLAIAVMNPLTKQYRALPPLPPSLVKSQPKMVQLVMDRGTKVYKVIVVGNRELKGGTGTAGNNNKYMGKVWSSATGKWNRANNSNDFFFGHRFRFYPDGDDELDAYNVGPCFYDCEQSQLHELNGDPAFASCKAYALSNDRLFVLNYETRMQLPGSGLPGGYMLLSQFVLSEFQGQRRLPHWVRIRDHDCTPLIMLTGAFVVPLSDNFYTVLHACRNYVMVTVVNNELGIFKAARTWLYDLCTFQWHQLPPARMGESEPSPLEAMTELHWDAVP